MWFDLITDVNKLKKVNKELSEKIEELVLDCRKYKYQLDNSTEMLSKLKMKLQIVMETNNINKIKTKYGTVTLTQNKTIQLRLK